MEVLAPVGSREALKAAVLGGADAVYLGGKEFGARRKASNFTDPELRGAVRFAHDHGVRVHVTVNILVKEGELRSALSFIDLLDEIEADAIITQDRGLLRMIRDRYSIPVHASTQMGIHSPDGVRWAKENGISRVILARELRLEEIERIRKASEVELEVFIHGALCYSVSGQCLFSSMVGGRSGNRGLCAQPCRKRYSQGDDEGFLLSTADLFSVNSLPELMDMGIDCIKIEGRGRSPLYTYLVSRAYRNAVDRAEAGEDTLLTPREREMLQVVFNRGFTPGHLVGADVMQREYPDSRGLPIGEGVVDGGELIIDAANIDTGDGITLYRDGVKTGGFRVNGVRSGGGKILLTPPFDLAPGKYRVFKTRDREFDALMSRISEIALPDIPGKRRVVDLDIPRARRGRRETEISCYLSSINCLERVLPHAKRVYFETNPRYEEAREMCEDAGVECVLMLPRVTPRIPDVESDNIMISSMGQFQRYRGRRLYGHYSLNFLNSMTGPELYQQALSVEMTQEDIRRVASRFQGRIEVLGFGRIELMVTRDTTIHEATLVDGGGRRFRVYRDREGFAHIMNSADLLLLDFLDDIEEMGVDSIGLDLRRRSPDLCELVTRAFRERDMRRKGRIRKRCGHITSGHFLRGVS